MFRFDSLTLRDDDVSSDSREPAYKPREEERLLVSAFAATAAAAAEEEDREGFVRAVEEVVD